MSAAEPPSDPDAGVLAADPADSDSGELSRLFGFDGAFAAHIEHFKPRSQQIELALAVDQVLASGGALLGEAGTGVGKTFAYLAPALASGQKVIVSTGTKHLQDQLFGRDLPTVARVLGLSVPVALLKGRANYLCKHRLTRALRGKMMREPQLREQLQRIRRWSEQTRTGDIAEVIDVPEGSPVWAAVTSNEDICRHHEADELKGCYVSRARRKAQDAQLIVVNHHLFCADLALKDTGFGEILPLADAIIIDEAHQLPEIAANYFGRRLSSRQLLDLARDTAHEQMNEAPDQPELRDLAADLEQCTRAFRLALGMDTVRGEWDYLVDDAERKTALHALRAALEALSDPLSEAGIRGRGLGQCARRAETHLLLLDEMIECSNTDVVQWYETTRRGFFLSQTPLNVAEPFSRAMGELARSWIFVSATLAVSGEFGYFKRQLGLEETRETRQGSPFNYQQNALLYLPDIDVPPQHPQYTRQLVTSVLPLIRANRGRAFFLFTSFRALNEARALLEARLDLPLLVQGDAPKRELLEAFLSLGDAVLLGTASFWEGVDVRGEALSLVIIDKLPFAAPNDPVVRARIQALDRAGDNAFMQYQVPQAAISLQQGVGRLIRDVDDRGVMVLADPRIRTRHYGKVFVDSLPPMTAADDEAEALAFIRAMAE